MGEGLSKIEMNNEKPSLRDEGFLFQYKRRTVKTPKFLKGQFRIAFLFIFKKIKLISLIINRGTGKCVVTVKTNRGN